MRLTTFRLNLGLIISLRYQKVNQKLLFGVSQLMKK